MTRGLPPREHGRPVIVEAGAVTLDGHLAVPDGARGVVLFAHGSGSGRHSPRNQAVAAWLRAEPRAGALGIGYFGASTGADATHRRRPRRAGARPQPAGAGAAPRPDRAHGRAGATHLFEEPGALERVAELARDWFGRHLVP